MDIQPTTLSLNALERPTFSIVVATYNRGRYLGYLLDGLARQIYPARLIELIVVDDGSTDETYGLLKRWGVTLPFPLRVFRQSRGGPASARNRGSRAARGQILAFTDSDCVPQPRWLRAAAEDFMSGADFVCGTVRPKWVKVSPLHVQLPPLERDFGIYPTANLLMRRELFLAVGGFDESFHAFPWGQLRSGEDSNLAWRLRRRGHLPLFDKVAEVWHLPSSVPLRRFLLGPVVVEAFPRLLRTVPELRTMFLWRGYFLSKFHFYFCLAIAGTLLALLTGSWLPLVLAIPFVNRWMRDVMLPLHGVLGFWKGLALSVLICYLEAFSALVLLVAGARYRRLVL
jgi:glycosyltransferase involved in cell wall biosynthesis